MSDAPGLRVATWPGGTTLPMAPAERWPTSVRLAAVAIALHFFVSSSLLFICGIQYDVPGGNPVVKFHPASYLIVVAAAYALKERRARRSAVETLVSEAPAELCFILAMIGCSVFAEVSIGTRGAAVFIENFVSAGLLAYVLGAAPASSRAGVGRLMLWLCLVNVVVAVGETLTHSHVVPLYLGENAYIEQADDFRGIAGYDHPLTGAIITMMALLSLPRIKLSPLVAAASFGVLAVGLLAFGGRTALAVSIVAASFLAVRGIVLGLARRQLALSLVASVLVGVLVLPLLGYGVLNYTPVGTRVATHLFVDESAETRSVQWRVLDKLSLKNELFGVPEDDIPFLIKSVDYDEQLEAIENPWLLIFLKLGAVGSAIFLAGLVPLLLQFWSRLGLEGRLVLIAGLAVMSSSNSVGVKSNVFFCFVAFVMSAADYATPRDMQKTAASPVPAPPKGPLAPSLGYRGALPGLRQL